MKSRINFFTMLLAFSLIPVLMVSIILSVVSCSMLSNELEKETELNLEIALKGFSEYYNTKLSKVETNEDIDYTYMDSFKENGIELTVFVEGARKYTSIVDESGERIIDTRASDEVINEVETKGNRFFSKSVDVNGEPYYGLYVPLKLENGSTGMLFAGTPKSRVTESIQSLVLNVCVILAILVAITCVLVTLLAIKVRKPMNSIAESMRVLADGRLQEKITATSSVKEIKTIVESAIGLQASLHGIVGDVRQSTVTLTDSISDASKQSVDVSEGVSNVATTVSEVSAASVNMAEDVQDASTSVSNIAQCITDIVTNVESLASGAELLKTASNDVSDSMADVYASSSNSVKASEEISKKIEETSNIVSRINDAVEAIINISSQTNLLSLNASIEAARAGEAGKGFAVVADSIKTLSTESSDNAKEISSFASNIIDGVNESVVLVQNMSKIIVEEQLRIDNAKKKIDVLDSEIEKAIEEVSTIGTLVDSIDKMKDQIMGSMENLSAISEENAASSEQISVTVESMSNAVTEVSTELESIQELAANLKDAVDVFQ